MERKILICMFLAISQCYGEQTIDEMIAAAAKSPMDLDMVADEKTAMVKTEMDIIMPLTEYMEMKSLSSNQRRKRKAERLQRRRWTNKVVPYQFATSFDATSMNQINLALNEWNNFTCLTFRQAQSTDPNRIEFDGNGSGCSSFVGMIGGVQRVSLANGCRVKRIIVHELGHAVGFQHEQSRPDRDGFVQIVTANIPQSLLFNFEKLPESRVNNFDVQYDYRSVMHYSARAFSTNNMITVRTIDPNVQNIIGRAPGLSFRDIKLANLMYTCNENCETRLNCPGEGFQGRDCNCYCPSGNPNNPIQLCTDTVSPVTTTTPSPSRTTTTTVFPDSCVNMNRNCDYWAENGECTRFRAYMSMYCPLACNTCSPPTDSCQDMGMHCQYLGDFGYCNSRVLNQYMRANCARTCNFCDPEVGSESQSPENGVDKKSSSVAILLGAIIFLFVSQI